MKKYIAILSSEDISRCQMTVEFLNEHHSCRACAPLRNIVLFEFPGDLAAAYKALAICWDRSDQALIFEIYARFYSTPGMQNLQQVHALFADAPAAS